MRAGWFVDIYPQCASLDVGSWGGKMLRVRLWGRGGEVYVSEGGMRYVPLGVVCSV